LNEATSDLERQAGYLFTDHTRTVQNSVILVGCSGEWWRWRVATREEFQIRENVCLLGEEEDEEYDDEDENDKVSVSMRAMKEDYDSDPLNIESMVRNIDIGEDEAPEVDDAEQAWEKGEWSLSLRLGTPASNQRLYLIHKHLSTVVDNVMHTDG